MRPRPTSSSGTSTPFSVRKLTFLDKNGNPVTPDILSIKISSTGNKTVLFYLPFYEQDPNIYQYNDFYCDPDSVIDGNIYFTTMFNDENKNDSIVFTAYDSVGETYSCAKAAPEGGFQNNKYYYGDAVLKWVSGPVEPTITGMNNYYKYKNPKAEGFSYSIHDDPINISISGKSDNCVFSLMNSGTFTMENLTAEVNEYSEFVYIEGQDIVLNLKGDNYIKMNESYPAFQGVNTTLKLKCEGDVATLKIWVKNGNVGGFSGFNNINFSNNGGIGTTDALDAEALKSIAAEGYTVERSAKIADGDGAYWIFTVRKEPQ